MNAKLNIDAIARRAQQEVEKPKIDMLKETLVVTPAGWNILIEPHEPRQESDGGIIIAQESQKVEEVQCVVGRVLACGPTALNGQTQSGIRICELTADISKPKDLIGKYVVYQRYTGQPVRLRKYNGKILLLITATEILAVVTDPNELIFWV